MKNFLHKIKKPVLWTVKVSVLLVLILVLLGNVYYRPEKHPDFGVSFSITHAKYLGLDWRKAYIDVLDDLKPKEVRLMSYWETIEPRKGEFDFTDVDWTLEEAGKRGVSVMLAVGHKQPRWPECHHPDWWNDLSLKEQNEAQLNMVKTAVEHFRSFDAVKVWQVENEPLFSFGPDCPKTNRKLLKEEVALVKSLDERPIITTDSGELGRWLPTATVGADLFGSTMYRVVHNPKFGHYKYPIGPWYFKIKSGLLKLFTKHDNVIGVELQAEPWFALDVYRTPLAEQYELMNPDIFKDNVSFATESGFSDHYLWGVEWWYWLKVNHGDSSMWDVGREVLK